MSEDQVANNAPKKDGSIWYIVAVIAITVVVLVAGILLNIFVERPQPEGPTPEPVDPPTPPTPIIESFEQEGEYYFTGRYSGHDKFDDSAIIESWDDIEEYFNNLNNIISDAYAHSGDFDFDEHKYLIVKAEQYYCAGGIQAVGITKVNSKGEATVVVEEEGSCGVCAPEYEYWLIEIDDYEIQDVAIKHTTINSYECDPDVAYKPVIYLYPEDETEVSVKLGAKDKLLVSYPKYTDGWKVLARPDGKLTDLQTGRSLYSLYYEADNTTTNGVHEDGFVVKGSDTVAFLEKKLAQLGLTDTEAEEFIIYWLPQMQNNKYNYIYFAIGDEVSANMPLDVNPVPATSIRVNMEWKPLETPIKVKEQKLPATPTRKGFTLVEWGGTILK